MEELKFYFNRFLRRIHWFLVIAMVISAIAVTVAFSLPPAYVSEMRLLVESQQIPDNLAEGTSSTPAEELLQIIQQRLMTRNNLLTIARDQQVFPNQRNMSPDEIVQAMRAHTTLRSRAGRNQATTMVLSFEAASGQKAAGVLNAYLSLILAEESEMRTGRATSTLEFFENQAADLSAQIDQKNQAILQFKNENADALPETLEFRMTQRSNLQERIDRIDSEIDSLQTQRQQLTEIFQATGRLQENAGTPEEQRLRTLEAQLDEAQSIYSEQHPTVRLLKARVAQAKAAAERVAGAVPEDDGAAADPETAVLNAKLAEIDTRVAALEKQRAALQANIAELEDSIARTPANGIALDGLTRDLTNIQTQYARAADRLARASTGERIELASRGQRITVVEPPAVPSEPTKPDRMRLALMGTALGVGAGAGVVFLLEFLNRTLRRPEDIVAHFEVMPIATIPYVRSRRQSMVERGLKISLILVILVGVPLAIYAVHVYYLPLDLLADKVMNKIGVRL